jgi:hypothetical protein
MSSIPFLFQLPSAWLVAVLSEWLDMPSIGMLDTAMTSKTHRSQFLANLQNMRSTSIDSFSEDFDHLIVRGWTRCWWWWLSIRQVCVESIVIIHRNGVRSDLVIPSMRKVVAKSFDDEDLQYLVRNCPELSVAAISKSAVD